MDSGMWTVAGTLIGAAATLLATRLNLKGRTDYFDEKCIRMIEEKFKKEKENDFTILGKYSMNLENPWAWTKRALASF